MTAQNMAKKILADSGYEVTTVSNGAAAVKKIAEVKPDLVILDIYMPGYTGLEVCERVRANLETTNLPVLLTVGKMEPYRAEDGARVRADGIIVKPFEATDLINIVKKISEKFAPAKPSNYGELETMAPVSTPVEEFPEPIAEETAARVEVPAEMAASPAMGFDEAPAAIPAAMDWGHASASVEPEALEFPPAVAEHAATPQDFIAAHTEVEAGTITDSMPAYLEPHATAPSFAMEPSQEHAGGLPEPEIEFTSAPQAKDVTAEPSADFEPTIRTEDVQVFATQDPDLVTAPEEISNFVTNFGVENAEEIPVGTVTGDEAFLAETSVHDMPEPLAPEQVFPKSAAEDFEIAEEPVAEEHPVEALEFSHSEPAQTEATGEPAPTAANESVDDFEARVAAAMSAFEQPLESSLAAEPEPVVEQVDNFIGDAEIVNPVAVDPEADSVEFKLPEPQPPAETRPTLDVNETMVLPAEALLSLEAEMRKALELKQSAEAPAPSHEQVMDDFTGPQLVSSDKAERLEDSVGSELPAAGRDDDEFARAVAARLREISEPEPQVEHVEEPHGAVAPMAMAAAAAVPMAEKLNPLGDETLALAVKKAVERLQPQLIAEIMKALKGE